MSPDPNISSFGCIEIDTSCWSWAQLTMLISNAQSASAPKLLKDTTFIDQPLRL
jgi:hypothetical protein